MSDVFSPFHISTALPSNARSELTPNSMCGQLHNARSELTPNSMRGQLLQCKVRAYTKQYAWAAATVQGQNLHQTVRVGSCTVQGQRLQQTVCVGSSLLHNGSLEVTPNSMLGNRTMQGQSLHQTVCVGSCTMQGQSLHQTVCVAAAQCKVRLTPNSMRGQLHSARSEVTPNSTRGQLHNGSTFVVTLSAGNYNCVTLVQQLSNPWSYKQGYRCFHDRRVMEF